jgi:hypothetical protein
MALRTRLPNPCSRRSARVGATVTDRPEPHNSEVRPGNFGAHDHVALERTARNSGAQVHVILERTALVLEPAAT